jgi:hypothetical protein
VFFHVGEAFTRLDEHRREGVNVLGHIAHVVHGVVCAHGAGVLGLDELHLPLPEIHEGVMPTPPGRSAALKGHLVLLP